MGQYSISLLLQMYWKDSSTSSYYQLVWAFPIWIPTFHTTDTENCRQPSATLSIKLLLDLSAAFDTILHDILTAQLSAMTDLALSYLINRHFITLNKHKSSSACGSQRCLSGFCIRSISFHNPRAPPWLSHGLSRHCYADDTHHISRGPSLLACVRELECWMPPNYLKRLQYSSNRCSSKSSIPKYVFSCLGDDSVSVRPTQNSSGPWHKLWLLISLPALSPAIFNLYNAQFYGCSNPRS